MPIGIPTGSPQQAVFTVTRNKLIELAHKVIGVLEPGQVLDGDMLNDGIDLLGLIVRETDAAGKWLWTINASTHLSLAASTHRYDAQNGLPQIITDLLTVYFRDSTGQDRELKILKHEQYESICDKLSVGDPSHVHLTEQKDLASRVLYVWPMLSSIIAQSAIVGTDSEAYKCIYPHAGAAVTRPITGANWRMAWELGGSMPAAWASGASYTCGEQLRISYRRPIYDFYAAADTPDFPLEWPRTILYKLAFDLGDVWGVPMEERQNMVAKAKGAFNDVFQNVKAKSKNIHGKASYF